ncbi:AhpC/TSA family protein [Hazenella sp. IB182353]|uniref:peroxiredoxin-like family protein n=1 Tax=Polycladospora coralii TaxID=2771432 RepID=UPI0017463C8B|nr:peroxiredoxin-like family protein [Polycladospora coralii]MBS7531314.1 AhpC/TSA family protein [Polycladospora coralii]
MRTLTETLEQAVAQSMSKIPKEVLEVMQRATHELADSDMGKGLKVGDSAPDFKLKNAVGKEVSLSDKLKNGSVVLVFYRGEWCPYCNLELKAYQELAPEFKEKGVEVIAISPETPDHTVSMQQKHDLTYEVLSDSTKQVIKDYQLLFDLPDYLIEVYEKFGIDLTQFNAKENAWSLPVPATYVISQEGKIAYVEANPDYTKRLEPKEALETAVKVKQA